MAHEERASDIVVEETELDQAIEDIIDMTEAAEEEHAHKAAAKRASEKEKITAEDVRKSQWSGSLKHRRGKTVKWK